MLARGTHDRRANTDEYLFPNRPNEDFGVMSAGSQFERFLGTSGDVAVDRIWDFAIGRCPALDPKDEPWQTAAGRWDGGLSLLHVWAFHITTK